LHAITPGACFRFHVYTSRAPNPTNASTPNSLRAAAALAATALGVPLEVEAVENVDEAALTLVLLVIEWSIVIELEAVDKAVELGPELGPVCSEAAAGDDPGGDAAVGEAAD